MNNPSPFTRARGIFRLAFVVVAAGLLVLSLKMPLWQMRLEAPQYRDDEALKIAVYPNVLRGDIRELTVLNRYIGVHVPATLPQFKWLPAALIGGALLAMGAALMPLRIRHWSQTISAMALIAALGIAATQAKSQIYDIGHNRDQHTPLAGVPDFTPPFLGTTKIAQFQVSSRLGLGAWLIGGALALQFGAAWLSRSSQSRVTATIGRLDSAPAKEVGRLTSTAMP